MRLWISPLLWLGLLLSGFPLHAEEETTADVHKRLSVTFTQADTNLDQKLSLAEFLAGRDNPAIAKRDFQMCDFNEDQHLALDEFLTVPSVLEAKHRVPMPDLITGLVDQMVAALDTACDDWDREPNREIKASAFLERLDGQMRRWSGGGILIDDLQIDPDRSGAITRAEARRYIEIGMGVRNSDGAILRMPNGEVVKFVLYLDSDGNWDTQLDEHEFEDARRDWPDAVDKFTEIDLDRNGLLSAGEWVGMKGRPVYDPVTDFGRMDTNLDARLDLAELVAGTPEPMKPLARRICPGFDWDGDGVLSLAEYRTTMIATPIAPWQIWLYDHNSDGSLNLGEFVFDSHLRFAFLRMMFFRRLDQNGDQKLDGTEWDSRRKQPDEFFVMNEDGTGWKSLDQRSGSKSWRHPAVSPDGKNIAFDSPIKDAEIRLFIMPVDGGTPKDLEMGMMPSWLADGKSLICSRRDESLSIWQYDLVGRENCSHHLIENGWGGRVSPDGKIIAVHSGPSIVLYDRETDSLKTVFDAPESPFAQIYGNLIWSPDGKQVCFRAATKANQHNLVTLVLSATDMEPRLKVHFSNQHFIEGNIAWHPQKSRIVFSRYSRERRQRQLFEFDPTRDDAPKLMHGQDATRNNTDACWTPDGKRLIVISGDF